MDIEYKFFSEINLNDTFFDSLRKDYPEFNEWFQKKSATGAQAYVAFDNESHVVDFMYLKEEIGPLGAEDKITPEFPSKRRLKVGTFKILARHTTRGERFIKKILDIALLEDYEEVYVTVFSKHERLISLFEKYGFERKAEKCHPGSDSELVLIRDLGKVSNDIYRDYPLIDLHAQKYLLAVYPKYHTKIFPDSILKTERLQKDNLIQDISPTNSIHKIYLCFMKDVSVLKKGDLIAIYRTSDIPGKAYYRSVVTSICTVEEIKVKSNFTDVQDFLDYANKYSVFNEDELRRWYVKPNIVLIKMLYNVALSKRLTRQILVEDLGFDADAYWGFMHLTDNQFNGILKKGEADENFIIN